MQDKLVKLAVT